MKRRDLLLATPLLCANTGLFAQTYPAARFATSFRWPPAAAAISSRAPSPSDGAGRSMRTFVVDNQGGGGGVIACQTTAKAAPDGYTLMQGYVATHGTAPATRKVPYDPIKDFTPIGMIGGTPNVLVVNSTLAPTTPERVHRLFEEESGQGELRFGRRRFVDASDDGVVQATGRELHGAHPVSRHRAGVHRSDRRPDAGDVPGAGSGDAAHPLRSGATAGSNRQRAPSAAERHADDDRVGLQGIRRAAVVRRRRPRRHAGARGQAAQCFAGICIEGARPE